MLSKKFAIIPALVAIGVFATQINLVSAGPDGGDKNGGDHDGDGGGKNGDGGGEGGGKNGGDDGHEGGGKNGDDDHDAVVRSHANSKAHNRFLARWNHKQRKRHTCGRSVQLNHPGHCGQVHVTVGEPVYAEAPVRKKRRKARRVAVVQHEPVYDDGYYAEPVVRYVAQPSRAALMQAQKRARRQAHARYQVVDGGYAYDEQVVVRVKKRKARRIRQAYLPGYDTSAVIHYGPLVEKNGAY